MQWGQGHQIKLAESMGLMAMVYLLFFNLNALSFSGLNTLYQFAASIERLATLFK